MKKTTSERDTILSEQKYDALQDTLRRIVSDYPGEIGIALIINNSDTITVNNKSVYPMMSVFKLHQALALCKEFDKSGESLDSILIIHKESLDKNTWSPMLKDYSGSEMSLTVGDLMKYALIQSDNNASNLLFKHFVSLVATDSIAATMIPRHSFKIAYSEHEMSKNHELAKSNFTSPLGAAMLINRLFTDSIISAPKQEMIKQALLKCSTGNDRISAPLIGKEGVVVAHKTGSGYIKNGILVAHNDVAYINLPDDTSYSLAVFVMDFKGNEQEASQAIARISEVVYNVIRTIN